MMHYVLAFAFLILIATVLVSIKRKFKKKEEELYEKFELCSDKTSLIERNLNDKNLYRIVDLKSRRIIVPPFQSTSWVPEIYYSNNFLIHKSPTTLYEIYALKRKDEDPENPTKVLITELKSVMFDINPSGTLILNLNSSLIDKKRLFLLNTTISPLVWKNIPINVQHAKFINDKEIIFKKDGDKDLFKLSFDDNFSRYCIQPFMKDVTKFDVSVDLKYIAVSRMKCNPREAYFCLYSNPDLFIDSFIDKFDCVHFSRLESKLEISFDRKIDIKKEYEDKREKLFLLLKGTFCEDSPLYKGTLPKDILKLIVILCDYKFHIPKKE